MNCGLWSNLFFYRDHTLSLIHIYPDKIFTRLQLMDEIWGMDSETVDTTVNVLSLIHI